MTGDGLGEIYSSVDNVIAVGTAAAEDAPPSREKTLLETVLSELRRISGQMKQELPGHLADLRKMAESVRDEAAGLAPQFDDARANLAEVEQQFAAARAAGPPVPVPPVDLPVPPLDFELGSRLRSELLARMVPGAGPEPAFDPGQDIWQDWK